MGEGSRPRTVLTLLARRSILASLSSIGDRAVSAEPQEPDTRSQGPDARWWHLLRRHGAFQAAIIFASAAWLVLQAADVFGLPTSAVRLLGVTLLVVFAALAVYAWVGTRARRIEEGERARTLGRRRWHAAVAAAVALLLLGGGAWWLRPRLFGAVRPGADVIAVLPFNTSGPSVRLLGEGLVDLLSTNLNEVGHVRAIDPRTTLHRWKQAATNGAVDLEGALEIGRAVGAGSVLLGSVVEAGNSVRLAAELIAVDGGRLAKAEKEGVADSVFALVDGLSVELLRDVWRTREPLPQLRIGAITTSSPEALRAYLQGEQHLRRSQFDSARAHFERAVAEDSTFALAYFRLSEACGWGESGCLGTSRSHAEAAARLAGRLPAPERSLMAARVLHSRGDLSAVDTLRAYVARYPDDAGGWYLFADARYHAWRLLDVSIDTLYYGFDRALELDPSFSPARLHPLGLSMSLDGDSARQQRYLSAFDGVQVDAQAAAYPNAAFSVRWSPRETRLETLSDAILDQMSNPAIDPAIAVVTLLRTHNVAALADTIPEYEEIREAYGTARAALPPNSPHRHLAQFRQVLTAASMGQFRAARAILDTLRSTNRYLAFAAVLPVALWGARPDDYGAQEVRWLEDPAAKRALVNTVQYWQALFALRDDETTRASRILDEVGQPTDSAYANIASALRGIIRIAEGDTVGGMREAEAGLKLAGYFPPSEGLVSTLRTQLALTQATRTETRDAAIRHLRLLTALEEPAFSVLLAPPLAEAYERAGMTAEAARTWMRYIAVLDRGDPEVQPYVEAARHALDNLVAEPESGRPRQ